MSEHPRMAPMTDIGTDAVRLLGVSGTATGRGAGVCGRGTGRGAGVRGRGTGRGALLGHIGHGTSTVPVTQYDVQEHGGQVHTRVGKN
jgi:hypothetical protein